jgi:pyrimidine operon attenuation protein/uracil phosphoribosyltransferase
LPIKLRNLCEQEIVIAGATNGFIFAKKIAASLELSSIKVSLCEVQINKQHPELPIHSLSKERIIIRVWFLR